MVAPGESRKAVSGGRREYGHPDVRASASLGTRRPAPPSSTVGHQVGSCKRHLARHANYREKMLPSIHSSAFRVTEHLNPPPAFSSAHTPIPPRGSPGAARGARKKRGED